MNIRPIYILLLAAFLFGGCSNTVTDHYPTRAEAEADNLFERGWLPSFIPASANDITTSNNLDISTSEGEFRYNPKQANEFLAYLKPYSGQNPKFEGWQTYIAKQIKNGNEAFEYCADKTVWVFFVNAVTGHVRYIMWYDHSSKT